MRYFVYILYSPSLDRYYVGHTEDLEIRLHQHNTGRNKSTKGGIPWDLKYTERFGAKPCAFRREQEIKAKKSRKYLEWLISAGG